MYINKLANTSSCGVSERERRCEEKNNGLVFEEFFQYIPAIEHIHVFCMELVTGYVDY